MAQAGNGGALFGPRISWAFLNLGRVRQQIKAAGHRAIAAQNDVVLSRTRAAAAWVRIGKAMGGGI